MKIHMETDHTPSCFHLFIVYVLKTSYEIPVGFGNPFDEPDSISSFTDPQSPNTE